MYVRMSLWEKPERKTEPERREKRETKSSKRKTSMFDVLSVLSGILFSRFPLVEKEAPWVADMSLEITFKARFSFLFYLFRRVGVALILGSFYSLEVSRPNSKNVFPRHTKLDVIDRLNHFYFSELITTSTARKTKKSEKYAQRFHQWMKNFRIDIYFNATSENDGQNVAYGSIEYDSRNWICQNERSKLEIRKTRIFRANKSAPLYTY